MARPVRFEVAGEIGMTPEEIGALILEPANWKLFTGWGPMPGIREARIAHRPDDGVVGMRFAVTNTDGSQHVEEVIAWELPRAIGLRLCEFSRPLSFLASGFEEWWRLEAGDASGATRFTRAFELTPKGWWTRPMVKVIAWMLRKAVVKNLNEMGAAVSA